MCRAPAGPPGNLGQNRHRGSPFPPGRGSIPRSLNPPRGRARRPPSPSAGVRAFAIGPRAGGNVAKPGPCHAGEAWLSCCVFQHCAYPGPARSGRRPGSPVVGVTPCQWRRSRLPPRAPSLPGLPARLTHSQVRGIKARYRGTLVAARRSQRGAL